MPSRCEIHKKINALIETGALESVKEELIRMLSGITKDYRISSRIKEIDSTYHKMLARNYSTLSQINDLAGIAIEAKTLEEVYKIKDMIVQRYAPLSIEDYIRSPKLSGYESIHLDVAIGDFNIEIQIKTYGMRKAQELTHEIIYKNRLIPRFLKAFLNKVVSVIIMDLEYLRNYGLKILFLRKIKKAPIPPISTDRP